MIGEAKTKIPYEYIKDPIYGYIRLYDHEKAIIDTPSFQRLRRLKQLASAQYVYPGATHTRFSHSIGVMHLSGLFATHLLEAHHDKIPEDSLLHFYLLMRLWGLTHDLGHGPFSHTFDRAILYPLKFNHEYMSSKIVREDDKISSILDQKLKDYEIDSKVLSDYLLQSREEWPTTKLGKTEHSEAAFYYVLNGIYSTDIIDYLLRDNHYTGAGYGNFDWQRLILSSCLNGSEVALDRKAHESLEAFLLSRWFSFSAIYYHRTSRSVDHVMKTFLRKANEKLNFNQYVNDLDKYRQLDEQSIFYLDELKEIEERNMLINRQLPFHSVTETDLPAQMPFLDEDVISDSLSKELGRTIPSDLYFVDTPDLHLNPMRGENICWIERTMPNPKVWHQPPTQILSMQLPTSFFKIRLYILKGHEDIEQKLKKAIDAVIKGETIPGTHY